MSSVLAASRYGASAPPRHVSGLSNDSRDLVPRQTSYDDDSFDADSSGGLQASAAHRRRAPRKILCSGGGCVTETRGDGIEERVFAGAPMPLASLRQEELQ